MGSRSEVLALLEKSHTVSPETYDEYRQHFARWIFLAAKDSVPTPFGETAQTKWIYDAITPTIEISKDGDETAIFKHFFLKSAAIKVVEEQLCHKKYSLEEAKEGLNPLNLWDGNEYQTLTKESFETAKKSKDDLFDYLCGINTDRLSIFQMAANLFGEAHHILITNADNAESGKAQIESREGLQNSWEPEERQAFRDAQEYVASVLSYNKPLRMVAAEENDPSRQQIA